MAVIGLISALVLPSVFNNVRASNDKARLREAWNAVSTVLMKGVQAGEITNRATVYTYFDNNLVFERKCTNSNRSTCFDDTAHHISNAYVLNNGVVVVLYDAESSANTSVMNFDLNGTQPGQGGAFTFQTNQNHPFYTGFAWTSASFTLPLTQGWCQCRAGEMMPAVNLNGRSAQWWKDLWS